jgi:hypothetical protein
MIKDIRIPVVKNVTLAVVCDTDLLQHNEWKVFLINSNQVAIENTLVASTEIGRAHV